MGASVTKIRAINQSVSDIQQWLNNCLLPLDSVDDEDRFGSIVCRHIQKGNVKSEEVFRLKVPRNQSDQWAESCAQDIFNRLQREASTLGGLQKWAIYAYTTSDPNGNHFARHLVKIQGSGTEEGGNDLDSEGPDKTGLVSQAMRHTEAFAKIAASSLASITHTQQMMIDRQSSLIESLFKSKVDTLIEMSSMLEDKHRKELEVKREDAKMDMLGKLGDKAAMLLPAIFKGKMGPEASSLFMAKDLLTSIANDENKLAQLANILSTEEMSILINLYKEMEKVGASAKKESNGE